MTTKQAVGRAERALGTFAKSGAVLTKREAVKRLAPTLTPLVSRGESWVVLAGICKASGLTISAALLRSYYMEAVRSAAKQKQGGNENE